MKHQFLHPIGVRITEVDSARLTAEDVDEVATLLARHGVAVMPDHEIDDNQFPCVSSFLRRADVHRRTLFSDQYGAYYTLPAEIRADIDGRFVTHVVTGLDGFENVSAKHPLVRVHPISGPATASCTAEWSPSVEHHIPIGRFCWGTGGLFGKVVDHRTDG
ncbi:hypothetical protein [Rhodococcus sp. 1168]|uniref:hypothetical protein n=1 Tax=Rhodococcus sp. 1168 TaxID=2018041 RepID=UPI000A0C3B0F|nr:hypothetical protein [Rhodococcus sp. 1168]ORI15431.1 hypothetical protein BJI47_14160 [Rhodococcus sp. 1168]